MLFTNALFGFNENITVDYFDAVCALEFYGIREEEKQKSKEYTKDVKARKILPADIAILNIGTQRTIEALKYTHKFMSRRMI